MAFDDALQALDAAAINILDESIIAKEDAKRMDHLKSNILLFCITYNYHANKGDFDQNPKIKDKLAKITEELSEQVRKNKIRTNDAIESMKGLYRDDVLNSNMKNNTPANEIANENVTWITVRSLQEANTLMRKNKFDNADKNVLINIALGKPVQTEALESVLLQSSNMDKEQRRIYRNIAWRNQEQVSTILSSTKERFSDVQKELNIIKDKPSLNGTVINNLNNLATRNDSGGVLKRNFDYYNQNKNAMLPADTAANKNIDAKYNDARKLAIDIATKRTQLELLADVEKRLIQERTNNQALDTLRRKPSMFSRAKLQEFELDIKAHTKEQKTSIEKSLDEIAFKRYTLQNEIRNAEKQAVKTSREITNLRREMVGSLAGKDNRGQTDITLKVDVLLENIKAEFAEKKELVDLRINELKKRGVSDNDPLITQQKELKNSIDVMSDMIMYDQRSENTPIVKLQHLDNLLLSDKFKNPALADIRKSAENLSSVMHHECKLLDRENEKKRDAIREQMTYMKSGSPSMESETGVKNRFLEDNIKRAMELNHEMRDLLKEQKNFTDDSQKHAERTAKYEHANEILAKVHENIFKLQNNPSNTAATRNVLDNIHAYGKDKALPDSTRKFINEMHSQVGKFVMEHNKNQKKITQQQAKVEQPNKIQPK